MAKTSESDLLKEIIRTKEMELRSQEVELRENFHLFYDSLKPLNIIKNSLNKVFKQDNMSGNLIGTLLAIVPIILEYKAGKISSGKPVRKIIGLVLSSLIGGIAAKNQDAIKSFGNQIIDTLFPKKEDDDLNEEKG